MTTMGLFVKYFHYTVIIAMVSYQYFSYLYYYDMHQCRYICCYFTLTYDDSVIYIMFHLKLSQSLCFSHKYRICSFVLFSKTIILQQTKKFIIFHFWSSETSAYIKFLLSHKATTERKSTFGGWMIFGREILIQT